MLCHLDQRMNVRAVTTSVLLILACFRDICRSHQEQALYHPSVRKQHNAGYKHKANVRTYYQQFEEQQTQSLIDQRIKEHLGQAAAFQVGTAFHQHLTSLPSQRPGVPILPTPILPVPGIRPPVLPQPLPSNPGYAATPPMPQAGMPPVASSVPPQLISLPRPPVNLPNTSGPAVALSSTAVVNPAVYPVSAAPTSGVSINPPLSGSQGLIVGGPPSASTSQEGFPYSQTSEANQ